MARPIRNNADYFPHDADMRNDLKIRALRREYGLEGYAIWSMFLEVLTDSDYFQYQWTETSIELLAGDFEIEPQKLKDIISYCQKINLLTNDGEYVFTEKLINRLETVLRRRKRQRKDLYEELSTPITPNETVFDLENPQSKEKKNKVNFTDDYSQEEFLCDWNAKRVLHLKKPSFLNSLGKPEDRENFQELKRNYTREDFQNALVGLFKQRKLPQNNSSMQSNPSHFLKFFNSYLTAFHDKNTDLYGKETPPLL